MTLMSGTEMLILEGVALAITAGILLTLADTPLYPIAIGIEIVTLFYLLVAHGSTISPQGFFDWLAHPTAPGLAG